MKAEAPIEPEEAQRAARLVLDHDGRDALGALAFDVLSRQAEGGTLFAGKEHVELRAEALEIDRDEAATEAGNLLAILERGADSPLERAVVAAFAVHGLGRAVAQAGAEERERILGRFVRHADWLEISSPYVVYALVDTVLDPETAGRVWSAVADAVVDDARGGKGPRHGVRARNAARVSGLASSTSESAADALERVAGEAEDVVVRALARELGAEPESVAGGDTVRGLLGAPPRSVARTVLRLVTGVAALAWVARLVGRLVGVRRTAEMELVAGGVVLRRRTVLLGRTVREAEERYTMRALAGVSRETRYPMLHVLVGLVALSAGILVGGLFAFDAVRTGETVLLLLAAGAVLVGGGLDLALEVLVPARAGRVRLDFRLLPGRVVRLESVAADEADGFIDALRRRS